MYYIVQNSNWGEIVKDESDLLKKLVTELTQAINRLDFEMTIMKYSKPSISDILKVIAQIAFIACILIAIIECTERMIDAIFPKKRYYPDYPIMLN